MCEEMFWPRNPPNTPPCEKPAVAEPAPLTGTVFKKAAPPTPPNSHCCALAEKAAPARSKAVNARFFIDISLLISLVVDHANVQRGGPAALRDYQRHTQSLRNAVG